ncbi:hypothetical protein CI109_101312 [Kwoniella shandongensis]|uniref:RING-type E3 ubiquitin transferase n=1 Tax=Kwoniella shandongensis TaxID=1734106 RepID=A0A5M6BWU2_9TREE|nr:uncharacterized protein CI109_005308 [Kwoniella shandongensis]KAA5526352.1 hypothetical protein CI109_005308 [Kwoniella shandongensis]
MPRKAAVDQSIYLDEAEGFILEHAVVASPPRSWRPLPPDHASQSQSSRLTSTRKKMDWEEEVRTHPDEPIDFPLPTKRKVSGSSGGDEGDDANKERCVICLMALRDRTVVGVCGHEFCFECIGVWANQSRRCPLCSADMAPFLLHDLDASTPTKFYLPPLPSRDIPTVSVPGPSRTRLPEFREREPRDEREKVEPDELDLQVERRREIYRHELYVKHIGSNPISHFRPNPTPRQISDDPILIQRATTFLRRELRVWSPLIDVEYLTTYILSLLKAIDIRSEPAIRLLADFLDVDEVTYPRGAEHFSHELYSFLRSPYKDLRKWDEVAQYDPIPSARPERSRSRSRSRSPAPRLISRSPSPRSLSSGSSLSRSPSPKRGRKWSHRDTFVPSASPDAKRWDEHDTWLDPDYAAWLDEERRREEDRLNRKKARRSSALDLPQNQKGMREWGKPKRVELLPSPPAKPHRLEVDDLAKEEEEETLPPPATTNGNGSGLTIKGAARVVETATPTTARQTLLERLAKAKAAQKSTVNGGPKDLPGTTSTSLPPISPSVPILPPIEPMAPPPPLQHSISDPTATASASATGVRAIVRARLKLRLKLENERAQFRRNVAESKAQELRRRLLEAKAKREAQEEVEGYGGMDSVLKKMDTEERRKEVRRRLMRLKMIEAETESERRQRELREKLLARKRGVVNTTTTGIPVLG